MKGVARGRLSLRSADDELLPHMNLAIAIGGGYFKRNDVLGDKTTPKIRDGE